MATSAAAAAAASAGDSTGAVVIAASPPSFHTHANSNSSGSSGGSGSGPAGLFYTCQSCHKVSALDAEAPLDSATLMAFNAAFPTQQTTAASSSSAGASDGRQQLSAAELLSESFVVLPAGKPASQFAPPSASPSLAQRIMGAVSGSSSSSNPASSPSSTNAAGGHQSAPTTFHAQVVAASRAFEIVTAACGVRQPLCMHCSHVVFGELDRKLADSEREKEEYQKYLKQVQASVNSSGEPTNQQQDAEAEDAAFAAEDAELSRQEALLESQLASVRREKQALHLEADSLEAESARLSSLEASFWREYEDYSLSHAHLVEEQAHLGEQIRAASENLDRLSHTNVFDDAFHISWDGHFATINGFRLGRLPSQPVEWAEISAALGQALLLLATMARQTEYKFQKYRLIPMGSYSKLCRADDPSTTYELYGSNDLILGRLFWYRRFDQALVWLLACIQEFAEFAHAQDKAFTLKYPYVPTVRATVESKLQWRCSKYRRIHGDLIGGQSIKLQFNNDRAWSKALKYMLINLKFMLGWTARRMATSKQ